MTFAESIRIALASLLSNKQHSILTMPGNHHRHGRDHHIDVRRQGGSAFGSNGSQQRPLFGDKLDALGLEYEWASERVPSWTHRQADRTESP